jgi:NAD(P)-dependent dehydrogenase (short-subunit alcohol dehydrogenase family)
LADSASQLTLLASHNSDAFGQYGFIALRHGDENPETLGEIMNNKVALITGGATGIGKATALILASRGVKVAISGRRDSLGQKLVEEIRASVGEAAFIAASVDDEAEVLRTIEFAVSKYGRLDLAVNNAGIANETKAIGDSDPAMFKRCCKQMSWAFTCA